MNSKMRFLRSGILLTLVGLSMKTVSMFFAAYVSRTVGAEGIGLYTLVMTVYSFAVTFATSGISLTVTRLVAGAVGEGKAARPILRAALLYAAFFAFLGTVALFFGAELISQSILDDKRTADALKILSASLLPISLGSVFSGYFVGVRRIGFNAAVQIAAQSVKILLTVFLVGHSLHLGVANAVAMLCLASTLAEFFAFFFILAEFLFERRRVPYSNSGEKSAVRDVVGMAFPLALSAYFRSVLMNLEHILIQKKLRESGESSTEAYSHYGILHGMALPTVLYPMSPLSSFSGLLVPEFAEDMSLGREQRMSRIASKAMEATLVYAVISAVFLFAFSEELGYTLYSSYDAGYYISTLSMVVPIMYLDHVTDSILKGIGEQVFSMWVNITDSLLSVILVWFLIPRLGIMGYAVVIVVMEGYNFLLSFYRLRSRIKCKIEPVRSIAVPLAASFISSSATRALFNFSGSCASAFALFLKILFALSLTVFSMAICNAVFAKKDVVS